MCGADGGADPEKPCGSSSGPAFAQHLLCLPRLPLGRLPCQDSVPTSSILFTPQLHPNYPLPSASGLKCGFSRGH